MWTAIFPLWARILVIVAVVGAIWGDGWYNATKHQKLVDGQEMASKQHDFDVRIAAADDERDKANARANEATQGSTKDQTAINDAYTKGRSDEAAASKARVAQFNASGQRVRIDATCRPANASSGGAVPGVGPAPSGSGGAAGQYAELNPEAFGRFEAVATEVIGGLNQKTIALQARADSDIKRCNSGNSPVTEGSK